MQLQLPDDRVRSALQLVQLLGSAAQVRQVEKQAVHTVAPTSTKPEAQAQVLLLVIKRWLTVLSQDEQLEADPQQVRQTGEQSWQVTPPAS
jgi:hypothetical protein